MRNFTFVFFILAFTAHGQTIADLKEVLKTKHLEGKCDEAFTTLETMIGSTKENDTLYYYRGWLHLNCSNNYDLAIADFDKALLLDQNSVYGNLGRGMALCLQGKPEEAIDYLEVARSFKPKLFETQ